MIITIHSNKFLLDGSGAMLWQDQQALLVADVHLGKIAHFRKHGSAVPLAAIQRNYKKLSQVISKHQPQTVIFMGDLFHSESNQECIEFGLWCQQQAAELLLVQGNHDILEHHTYNEWGLKVVPHLQAGPFYLSHEPCEQSFNICGHIHPAVRLQGSGQNRLRLPCFYKTSNQLILPAFGTFTGNYVMHPQPMHEVYALAEGAVIRVN